MSYDLHEKNHALFGSGVLIVRPKDGNGIRNTKRAGAGPRIPKSEQSVFNHTVKNEFIGRAGVTKFFETWGGLRCAAEETGND